MPIAIESGGISGYPYGDGLKQSNESVSVMSSFTIKRTTWVAGTLCFVIFGVLLALRIDLIGRLKPAKVLNPHDSVRTTPANRDSWMKILQDDRKIGFAHRIFAQTENGHEFKETVRMRINTMGMIQDIRFKTTGRLNPDYTLASLSFDISSGPFKFSVEGTAEGNQLKLKTHSIGSARETIIELKQKPYLINSILGALHASDLKAGDTFNYAVFDPATMGQIPVEVAIIGPETISVMDQAVEATKVSLSFRGMQQLAWIDLNGDVLKEEGLLGISLEKTTPQAALDGLSIQSSRDLTKVASVAVEMPIETPSQLRSLTIAFSGISRSGLALEGGRQKLTGNLLTITKESLSKPGTADFRIPVDAKAFVEPTAFVQSDHPTIAAQAREIVELHDPPAAKAEKLVQWIYENIEKRPVLSLPDALSTLENRVGDCNEHAVLLAALARAVGIPAKIEAGLVYLRGRFYYHAWNLLFVGEWVTADALFGQMPVDVTHIRFTSGAQPDQIELMSVIGKIKLRVLKQEK